MAGRANLLSKVREILQIRSFSENQIDKLTSQLRPQVLNDTKFLEDIIDTWNTIMSQPMTRSNMFKVYDGILPAAKPPKGSILGAHTEMDMTHILADIEPDLLLLDPDKLIQRHSNIQGLGLAHKVGEFWLMLFNAPRGFYLQDWVDLTKKIYYLDHKCIELLYDKKERKEIMVHPIVKNAACVESDFDHIRTRYLFAERTGFKALSHLQVVRDAKNIPTLKDLILIDDRSFLKKFAPYCSREEYNCFSNLIKNYEHDDDDADIFRQLAELDSTKF